ncbi:hypothetical protein EYF80_041319 [Liparis tanakae]|uniref:Uncharacterized protein n=1 Tax=Liparis tanakae TaxID=230148 RepID=A0A4Z2G4L3_9TELE|nr:hypothetical protein EYF80_041319 [Liparis tanakae]
MSTRASDDVLLFGARTEPALTNEVPRFQRGREIDSCLWLYKTGTDILIKPLALRTFALKTSGTSPASLIISTHSR